MLRRSYLNVNTFSPHFFSLVLSNYTTQQIWSLIFLLYFPWNESLHCRLILNKLIICSALEELYLTGNSIKKISTVPKLLPNIQILNLSHNKLICLDLVGKVMKARVASMDMHVGCVRTPVGNSENEICIQWLKYKLWNQSVWTAGCIKSHYTIIDSCVCRQNKGDESKSRSSRAHYGGWGAGRTAFPCPKTLETSPLHSNWIYA